MSEHKTVEQQADEIVRKAANLKNSVTVAEVVRRILSQASYNRVKIEYAGNLVDPLKDRLQKRAGELFPSSSEVEFVLNPNLVAGIRVSYRDFVYEDNVKSRYVQMADVLAR